jgi:uncharacterized membrane protein
MNSLNVKKAMSLLLLLVLAYCVLVFSLADNLNETTSEMYKRRFWNAILTSFMIGSFMLLLTLVMYAESRRVRLPPAAGMLASGGVGALLMLWVLPALDVQLLEGNGTPFAQLLSNVLRYSATLLASMVSLIIGFGLFYSAMLPSKANIEWPSHREEE